MPAEKELLVTDDDRDLYGKRYFERMAEEGFPALQQRARADLPERCLHWMRGLIKYKLPPARVLELGSAHGGFVAMMRWAGYDAAGLDLSPALVAAARERFDVPIMVGPLETQALPPGSFDAIVLMDVLEHLREPIETLRTALNILKSDGIVFLQTPCYQEGKTLEQMESENDPFLGQLKAEQHLFLFSRSSVQLLFRRLGVAHLQFESAIFGFYDMALVAGREPLALIAVEQSYAALESRPSARGVLALLDLEDQTRQLRARYQESEADRAVRLECMLTLEGLVRQRDEDIQALQGKIAERDTKIAALEKGAPEQTLAAGSREAEALLARVRSSRVFAALRRVGLWTWLDEPSVRRPRAAMERRRPGRLKRVVIDLTPVLPGGENGGAKVMTVELIRHLAKLAPTCEFVLLTSAITHDELGALDAPNVQRLCVNQPGNALRTADNLAIRSRGFLAKFIPERYLRMVAAIYRELSNELPLADTGLLAKLNADLLFCPFTAPFFADQAVPVVSVIYDLQHIYYPQFFEPEEIQERGRNFRHACQAASKIVCISDYVRRTVLDNAAGLSPQDVETIHILIPRRLPQPPAAVRDRVLQRLRLEPDKYLLYPSNFWPHKNHEMLLTAYGMYRAANQDAELKLVLTGAPGERRDTLSDAVRKMGLENWVLFPGYLPEEELGALLHCSTAVIFPSLFEGFGMPLLEAMAAGKPLLSSTATSLPEVAGDAALYFDPRKAGEIAEAIGRIDRDPQLRSRLAAKGLERLRAFGGPADMAEQYLKVFRQAARIPRHASITADHGAAVEWKGRTDGA
jgi:glycosyltransferase involved in cell wall biosynthesis/SAM-dependent methyltransferase